MAFEAHLSVRACVVGDRRLVRLWLDVRDPVAVERPDGGQDGDGEEVVGHVVVGQPGAEEDEGGCHVRVLLGVVGQDNAALRIKKALLFVKTTLVIAATLDSIKQSKGIIIRSRAYQAVPEHERGAGVESHGTGRQHFKGYFAVKNSIPQLLYIHSIV